MSTANARLDSDGITVATDGTFAVTLSLDDPPPPAGNSVAADLAAPNTVRHWTEMTGSCTPSAHPS